MRPTHGPDASPRSVLNLTEWDHKEPGGTPCLKGLTLAGDPVARRIADTLRAGLDIREGYEGLEVTSTSLVGQVDVGPLRVVVTPKLPSMPLATLLRYAYGLRDITTMEETRAPTDRHGFQDLLIALLAAEVEELIHRGLSRRYEPTFESLASPRGRILVDRIAVRGGIREARLPCRHFERRTDWHLNRVLRSGLELAARFAQDSDLRRRAHRLSALFGDVAAMDVLRLQDVDLAERALTRMTFASQPSLTLIRLLLEAQGIAFDPSQPQSRLPGFLFDMNLFFQRLLSRFLRENLTNARIVDEVAIRNLFSYAAQANPRGRSVPRPRPDYALYRGPSLRAFLDAKYRDVWTKSLPAEWLYQLSIYALASPAQIGVLLYASMSDSAQDERIEIRQPVAWSSKTPAAVILRPVPLGHLAQRISREQVSTSAAARQRLADRLVDVVIRPREMLAA